MNKYVRGIVTTLNLGLTILGWASFSQASIPEIKIQTPKPRLTLTLTLTGRLIQSEEVKTKLYNEVIFIKGFYDANGDGVADFEVYYRVCNGKIVSENPYIINDYSTGNVHVYPNLDGASSIELKISEADMLRIYDYAPKCP